MKALFTLMLLALAVLSPTALANSPAEDAQLAELERARAEIADQVHLAAFDLIDELAFGWNRAPVFDTPTPVVLAGVTVPVGLGTGLAAMVENHIAAVLLENPTTNIQLVHCPSCTAVVVHSGPEGTVVSRGYDNPEVLAELGGTTGQHALFVDVEAEGKWLVLRARLTRLTPDLPIVWSHTLTTSSGTPALLRQPDDLKSAAEAREEYLDTLHDRGPITIPVRFAVRTFAQPDAFFTENPGVPPPPFAWLQTGVEIGATDARVWTSSLLIGGSFIPQAYQGLMGQARVSRLLTGRSRSLTRPDLYLFAGGSVMTMWGLATGSFQTEPFTSDAIILALTGQPPRTTLGALHLGLDLRLGNRIGFSSFLETMPSLRNSDNMGDYTRVLGIGFQTLGMEVTVCF